MSNITSQLQNIFAGKEDIGADDQLIEIIRTTDLLRDMALNGATETELWKIVNYLDSVIHDETITLETGLLLDNFKGKYQSKK